MCYDQGVTDMFAGIDLITISTEAILGAILNGILLSIIGSFVYFKAKKALKAGKLEDIVIFSFNHFEKREDGMYMLFKTPLTGTLQDIFKNDLLIQEIKKAADRTTDSNPIVFLNDKSLNNLMLSQLVNYCNRINLNGQAAQLCGLEVVEKQYQIALVYEPGAQKKLFRIIPINTEMLKTIDQLGNELKFVVSYHKDRILTLKALQRELTEDAIRSHHERRLTNFTITFPKK
jgi:hypothetical protein